MSSDAVIPCLDDSRIPTISAIQESKKEKNINDKRDIDGWTPLLVLAGITCILGSALPVGFNIGVVNNPEVILKQFCNESIQMQFHKIPSEFLLNLIWSVVVSIFLIGGVIGSLIASWIADTYGRRHGLGVGHIFGIIGAILFLITPTTNSVTIFIVARFIVGLSGGIATSLLSMYMIEIAPLKQRGAVGVFCQLGITVGVFLAQIAGLNNVLGTKNNWHIMLALYSPLSIISLVLLYFLPESPKYLYLIKHEEEQAIQELTRLRNVHVNLLQREIQSLQEAAVNSRIHENSQGIGYVLKNPTLRLPLLLVSFLQLGQQLSGINAIFYFSKSIFVKSKLTEIQSQYATLGTGVINIVMAALSVRLMSHYGRRTLILLSCYLSVACLFIFTVCYQFTEVESITRWMCVASLLIFVLTYGLGLGPIPYFIGSELFDVGPRPAAMAIGSICNWGGNFIVGLLFETFVHAISAYTFLIFITFTLLLAGFVRMYLPETRHIDTAITIAQLSHGLKSQIKRNTGI